MSATQIPQYLPDPPSLSFARRAGKPFRERALPEHETGQRFEEPQRALQQIVSGGCTQRTQQDCERELQELRLLLREQERSIRALKQPSPPEPANQFGFPRPGPQSPSPAEATGRHYFVNETNWKEILG